MAEEQTKRIVGLIDPPLHGIVMYPNLITPRAFKDEKTGRQGNPMFSLMLGVLPESEELNRIRAAAKEAAAEKFPGRPVKELVTPWKSGEAIADKAKERGKNKEAFRGRVWIRAKTSPEYPPQLSLLSGGNVVTLEDDAQKKAAQAKFYSGSEMLVSLRMKAYVGQEDPRTGETIDGVTAYLGPVLSLNRGARIGGGRTGADVFKDVVGRYTSTSVADDDGYDPDDGGGNW